MFNNYPTFFLISTAAAEWSCVDVVLLIRIRTRLIDVCGVHRVHVFLKERGLRARWLFEQKPFFTTLHGFILPNEPRPFKYS